MAHSGRKSLLDDNITQELHVVLLSGAPSDCESDKRGNDDDDDDDDVDFGSSTSQKDRKRPRLGVSDSDVNIVIDDDGWTITNVLRNFERF
jgi:hypothetical protein